MAKAAAKKSGGNGSPLTPLPQIKREDVTIHYALGHTIHIRRIPNEHVRFALEIERPNNGRKFAFVLKDNFLKPITLSKGEGSADWYEALTPEEQADMKQIVLAYYSKSSRDPDGMKTAAVGVVENPLMMQKGADISRIPKQDRHWIYVGYNTTNNKDKYKKVCAEFNAVEDGKKQMSNFLTQEYGLEDAELPKFSDMDVMGGRKPNPAKKGDHGVKAICPCGVCTDMLAAEMVPGGKVTVHPAITLEEILAGNLTSRPSVTLRETAKTMAEVKVESGEAWQTSINHLNLNREVTLGADEAQMQQKTLEWFAERLARYQPPEPTPEVMRQMAKNKMAHRRSIPELDVATKDGVLDIKALYEFQREQLLETLNTRVQRDFDDRKIPRSKTAILGWLKTKVELVRIAVIQTDDGCYHCAEDSDTGSEKAYINAESASITAAIKSLGTHGIAHSWPLEIRPAAIEKGEMWTTTKEGYERMYKRRTMQPGKELTVTQLPLIDPSLSREEMQVIADKYTFGVDAIYPGGFGGTGIGAQRKQDDVKAAAISHVMRGLLNKSGETQLGK